MSRAFLPGPETTWLLRACLARGDVAREAWLRWCDAVGDPLEALRAGGPALRRLLPFVQDAVQRRGLGASGRLATTLRAAAFREELRSRALRPVARQAIDSLSAAGVPFLLLRGVALAETAYAYPWLRHCHDVDLLLRRGSDRRGAESALAEAGFSKAALADRPAAPESEASTVVLVHASGLPVSLHGRLLGDRRAAQEVERMWERSRLRPICDTEARCLAPSDQLLQVCAHAWLQGGAASPVWACDAHQLVAHLRREEWRTLAAAAAGLGVVEPLAVALDYLAGALLAPVPTIGSAAADSARLHAETVASVRAG